jgi:DNA-binding transcriptional ArsR family regulator
MEHSTLAAYPPAEDYDAEEVLVVSDLEGLRAAADDLRAKILIRLRDHSYSVSALADELGLPKGTVAHHMKVLEKAGLVKVVRTRQVRAMTERYYGRVARLFLFKNEDYPDEERRFAASGLRIAAEELRPSARGEAGTSVYAHARLAARDAERFERRLEKLLDDFRAADGTGEARYGLAFALYPTEVPPRA